MREMRRKERQMPEEFAWEVADKCEYVFLAMTAEDGSPYGLPVTIARDGRIIYFHSAMEGRKEIPGVLTAYDPESGAVTVEAGGAPRTFEKKDVALVRLRVEF